MKNALLTLLLIMTVILTGCTQLADDKIYLGKFLDSDTQESDLKITKNNDNNYSVQISIHRLTSLDDGIAKLTKDGLKFRATDASGNPIEGIITVKDNIATVTFTNSSWEYIKNGSKYIYTKSH